MDSNETKVDTFLLSIEDARVVLTNNTEEWVKSGNISQKFSGNTYKITIYVSETHFVHLQVRSQDYNPAVAEFLSQIAGL